MKLTFDAEDAIIGMAVGLLVLGLSGKYYTLELNKWVYIIAAVVFAVFIVLDILNEFITFESHPLTIGILVVHNVIDMAICAALFSKFSGYAIPFITEKFVPYLSDPTALFYIGAFLVVGNALWLVTLPLWS